MPLFCAFMPVSDRQPHVIILFFFPPAIILHEFLTSKLKVLSNSPYHF